jgi:LmbE family N-acetylglucosaminyl deacetylase
VQDMRGRRLMAIVAHPDDETAGLGSTFAHYGRLGVSTSLVMATLGERGWTGPEAESPGLEAMGQIRRAELQAAVEVLGIDEVAHLGYTDGDVDQAEPAEIIRTLVGHVRRLRPQVVMTFSPDGAYGHPDHIAISQFATAALLCAADGSYAPSTGAPHRVLKLYFMVDTRETFEAYLQVFGDLTMMVDGETRSPVFWNDWAVTTRVDTGESWRITLEALRCHRSQFPDLSQLDSLPAGTLRTMLSGGCFYRAYSLVNGGRQVETDLFEGISV